MSQGARRGQALRVTRRAGPRRLPLAAMPVFRRKLRKVPRAWAPAWADDPDVDIRYHVRRPAQPASAARPRRGFRRGLAAGHLVAVTASAGRG